MPLAAAAGAANAATTGTADIDAALVRELAAAATIQTATA